MQHKIEMIVDDDGDYDGMMEALMELGVDIRDTPYVPKSDGVTRLPKTPRRYSAGDPEVNDGEVM